MCPLVEWKKHYLFCFNLDKKLNWDIGSLVEEIKMCVTSFGENYAGRVQLSLKPYCFLWDWHCYTVSELNGLHFL